MTFWLSFEYRQPLVFLSRNDLSEMLFFVKKHNQCLVFPPHINIVISTFFAGFPKSVRLSPKFRITALPVPTTVFSPIVLCGKMFDRGCNIEPSFIWAPPPKKQWLSMEHPFPIFWFSGVSCKISRLYNQRIRWEKKGKKNKTNRNKTRVEFLLWIPATKE